MNAFRQQIDSPYHCNWFSYSSPLWEQTVIHTILTVATSERPDLKDIDPELLSYITKEEFGDLAVDQKTKDAISNVMKYRCDVTPYH